MLTRTLLAYTFDDEGNRTRKTDIVSDDYTEYAWDDRNRLTTLNSYDSLDMPQGVVSYTTYLTVEFTSSIDSCP